MMHSPHTNQQFATKAIAIALDSNDGLVIGAYELERRGSIHYRVTENIEKKIAFAAPPSTAQHTILSTTFLQDTSENACLFFTVPLIPNVRKESRENKH